MYSRPDQCSCAERPRTSAGWATARSSDTVGLIRQRSRAEPGQHVVRNGRRRAAVVERRIHLCPPRPSLTEGAVDRIHVGEQDTQLFGRPYDRARRLLVDVEVGLGTRAAARPRATSALQQDQRAVEEWEL